VVLPLLGLPAIATVIFFETITLLSKNQSKNVRHS
jgi:hypothetical protein